MAQDTFCQKLKPFYIPKDRAAQADSPLTPAERKGFRGNLGALLWLCQTRLDLICDVVLQQQEITTATIKTLKASNALINRAKKYADNVGLYFPPISPPVRLAVPADSSHANKGTSYAQEGVLILLTSDLHLQTVDVGSQQYKAVTNAEDQMS